MRKILVALLVISAASNLFLWMHSSSLRHQLRSREANASEADELRARLQDLEARLAAATTTSVPDSGANELARLRNEVGQLRRQLKEAQKPVPLARSWRQLPATADWSEKFAAATNELARKSEYIEELVTNHDNLVSELAGASPDQLAELKRGAQSRQCIQNLKLIGLAAREWDVNNGDHGLPPNYLTMSKELGSPKVLFCPAAPGGVPETDWSRLNPAMITYPWFGATVDAHNPNSVLTTCPIHGHVGLVDGSVQMPKGAQHLY